MKRGISPHRRFWLAYHTTMAEHFARRCERVMRPAERDVENMFYHMLELEALKD